MKCTTQLHISLKLSCCFIRARNFVNLYSVLIFIVVKTLDTSSFDISNMWSGRNLASWIQSRDTQNGSRFV